MADEQLTAKELKEQHEKERLEMERKMDAKDLVIEVLRKEAAEGIDAFHSRVFFLILLPSITCGCIFKTDQFPTAICSRTTPSNNRFR